MNDALKPRLSPHDERRISVLAGVDPRTVRAYLDGKPQRSTVVARVRDALEASGLAAAPSGSKPGAEHAAQ